MYRCCIYRTIGYSRCGIIYVSIYMCVIYSCGDIDMCRRGRHIQGEKRVICGDWRAYVDPALPGVGWGVVGDMRHVDSVKSRVVA